MTEDEAKTTRCCGPEGSGRRVYAGHEGADVDGAVIYERFCIGSACMAWRWLSDTIPRGGYSATGPIGPFLVTRSDTDGYCGIASKP